MKKAFLICLIVSVGISALLGIGALLIGEFGEIQAKVLATTVSVSLFSIAALCCAAAAESGRGGVLPIFGIFVSAVAAILIVSGIWSDADSETYWKTAASFAVVGAAVAHMSLLSLARLAPGHRWVLHGAHAAIALLAVLIVSALWAEPEEEAFFRWLGIDAILATALTILVPILHRIGGEGSFPVTDEGRARRVVCPSCGTEETHPLGRIRCSHCGCVFAVRVIREGRRFPETETGKTASPRGTEDGTKTG